MRSRRPHPSPWLALALWLGASPALALALADEGAAFGREARPLLDKYCVSCHQGKKPKAGIDVDKFTDVAALARDADLALRVSDVILDRSMPPKGKPAPAEAERHAAADAIGAALEAIESVRDPGPSTIQRLTRRQYNNTIRDLLGVNSRPADAFPSDGGGGGGFDNNASTLFVPPILLERYLGAAADVLDRADPSVWRVASSAGNPSDDEAARRSVEAFASRAFRRPATGDEVDRLLRLYRKARGRGEPFDPAVKLALRAALVSPHFLFLVERDRPSSEPYRVTDHELASRLSYFLWSSMPDRELTDLASKGTLHDPAVLDRQVRRMIADPKSRALATDFAAQWLRVDTLATAAEPDKTRFPSYTPEVRDAMAEEVVSFFHGLLKDDRPVTDLIDAEYTYLNEPLAKHYEIEGVTGPDFRKVALKDEDRGGVLGMGAILTLTSYPRRTSPTLRGKWVLEEFLGTPPPPPPPMVKVLPADDRPKDGLTFRQRLEEHRKDPSCASCHSKLDPPGFGLETFDPVGRRRTEIGGRPVDAAGTFASGEAFNGPAELKRLLMGSKRDLVVKNLAGRMLSYSVRRGLEYYDNAAVRQIVAVLEAKGFRSTVLVSEVVKSFPFQYRRGESSTPGPGTNP